MRENNHTPSLMSVSTIPTSQQQIINKQKTVTSELNVTIEMPERLLTGRKMSPKSHERKLNKMVNIIGQVVEDAKKRYHDHVPTKIIVKVDENVKRIV
jgi:predicted DNA-binding helix-hairpin-helix protein